MPRATRALVWAAAAVVLATVFAWYFDPHLVVDLATRFAACF